MEQYSEKGSKRMLQFLLTKHKEILSEKLKEKNIESLYLFPDDNGVFHEHQLNNKIIMDKLGLSRNDWKNFWPARQPQWDGILVNENKNTIYLIEAKSHIGEIGRRTKPKEQSVQQENNSKTISKAIQEYAKKRYGILEDEKDKEWLWKYYQIANRLAFHQKLKDLYEESKQQISVKLIFLNFIKDPTWGKKAAQSKDDWDSKYCGIFKEMGLDKKKLENQGVIFINDIDVSSFNDNLKS